jgi:hypothetical protein
MRLLLPLVLLSSTALASISSPFSRGGQKPIGSLAEAVPGKSPVVYCDGHPAKDDILTIDFVDIEPNPPVK